MCGYISVYCGSGGKVPQKRPPGQINLCYERLLMPKEHARRAILFDLDGTLIDSLPDLSRALNLLLAAENRRSLTHAEVRPMIGDGAAKLVERALVATGGFAAVELPTMTRRFLALYEDGVADQTRPYPGVIETLEALRGRGYAMAVCTNKPYRPSLDILDALDLRGFFGAVIGGDSIDGVRKPDPRMVTAALAALHPAPQRALFVGDSANDVEAARGAGLPVAVVTFGYARGPVRELGADALIERFADLPAVVERLL